MKGQIIVPGLTYQLIKWYLKGDVALKSRLDSESEQVEWADSSRTSRLPHSGSDIFFKSFNK